MDTEELRIRIKTCIQEKIITFATAPDMTGTICEIGGEKFHFNNMIHASFSPGEYDKAVDDQDIPAIDAVTEQILQTLLRFRSKPNTASLYDYCVDVLFSEQSRKYRVFGHTDLTVVIDVMARNEKEAYKLAKERCSSLHVKCNPGNNRKTIALTGVDRTIFADNQIDYDDCCVVADDDIL